MRSVRRSMVFAILTGPVVVWACFTTWAQWKANSWMPGAGEMGLPVRVAVASGHWVVRMLPFAALPVVLAWPAVVPVLARVTGGVPSRKSATLHDIVVWWCVAGVAFAALSVVGVVAVFREPEPQVPVALLASLGWAGVVAYWLSMAAAYAVQQKRVARSGEYLASRKTPGGCSRPNAWACLRCLSWPSWPSVGTGCVRAGPSNKAMKLTKLSAAPLHGRRAWRVRRCRLVPARLAWTRAPLRSLSPCSTPSNQSDARMRCG